ASTEGLEDLFAEVPTSADSVASFADMHVTDADVGNWVSVIAAATALCKSERTIQRYAKQGKLQSKTDETGRLVIWLTTSVDTVATNADGLPTSANSVATSADNDRLWNLLKEKDAKIEALIMRNGYLQAQFESSQEKIKLLADSQHKPGWWRRFYSWFIGR
ncbi:MAG: hypothetical protein K2Y32_21705, partial [Candidatus Obscuribacterales bacterium]|nr:hypothetical protein [Candidatus Obscuribacterales bacterium]